jgi:hypothetical protein
MDIYEFYGILTTYFSAVSEIAVGAFIGIFLPLQASIYIHHNWEKIKKKFFKAKDAITLTKLLIE